MNSKFLLLYLLCCLFGYSTINLHATNPYKGEDAWLHYMPVENSTLKKEYITHFEKIYIASNAYEETIKQELNRSLRSLLSLTPHYTRKPQKAGICILSDKENTSLGKEGFHIEYHENQLVVKAATDAGLLYATYALIRQLQCQKSLNSLNLTEVPKIKFRMLNHWDDMNGNIERGYAGKTLWKWNDLPNKLDSRYEDYARLNASIGINGVVLNNVNADPRFLRTDYLQKIASLAKVFRKYHIKVYLSINFAASLKPSQTPDVMKAWGGVGHLETANPKDPEVQRWWAEKVKEIYQIIPDFGGFLVKANSEGMPGPQDYHCTHAEGANMLAKALKPYGGYVFWRTFVYNSHIDKDRMKRSYKEFCPLDGMFEENVILQAKNGPLDFQVIEPPQPLFGAMKQTNVAAELQITQEYIGHSTFLVYLLPMWKWFLQFDTHCKDTDSSIADIVTGETYSRPVSAIAGVANTGDSPNWTGHHFAQANWFAFGKLAWNPYLSEQEITTEWIKSTWGCHPKLTKTLRQMMLPTWKSFLKSNSPYGLGLTTDVSTHYKAAFNVRIHKEWQADSIGIGTDRSIRGTNFVSQYFEPNRTLFNDIETCPEDLLLCFHYVKWDHRLPSGHTLKHDFLKNLKCSIKQADRNIALWQSLADIIDETRYKEVLSSLQKERADAELFWKEADTFFRKRMGDSD